MPAQVSDLQSSLDRALLGPSSPRLLTRLRVLVHRAALDRRLADGAPPQGSPELELRARRLVSGRNRTMLADSINRLLADAGPGRRPRWSAAVPLNRSEIVAARQLLLRIDAVLRLEGPVYCQGVALLERMLGDGASAFYGQNAVGQLQENLERVIAALEGR